MIILVIVSILTIFIKILVSYNTYIKKVVNQDINRFKFKNHLCLIL